MANNLIIELADSSFYIDPGQPTNGELKVMIRNDQAEDVLCELIKIKIPYGDTAEALTNSNDFSMNISGYAAETDIEGRFLNIYLFNGDGSIRLQSGSTEVFHFYRLPFITSEERTVNIAVECYAKQGDEQPVKSMELPFKLSNQPKKPQAFVNYFAIDKWNVQENETIRLSWQIAHGKTMVLYPNFLGSSDQPLPQKRTIDDFIEIKEEDQPFLIDSQKPIIISQSSGSLALKLVHSTQFTLVADRDEKKGARQLTVYLKELTIIDFSTRDYDRIEPYPYLKPLTLDWIFTFSDNTANNKAYLIILELDNQDKPLPLDENSPKPPVAMNATRVVELNPRENYGSYTVYPVRKTKYALFLSENNIPIEDPKILTIMTTSALSPIGSITMFMGDVIPTGWRLCAGGEISKEEIPDTFDELARTLRHTNNKGVLSLPNLSDRFPVATGSRTKVADKGGPDPVKHYHHVDPPKKGNRFYTNTTGNHSHELDVLDPNRYRPKKYTLPYLAGQSGLVLNNDKTFSNGGHKHYVDVDIKLFSSQYDRYSRNESRNAIYTKRAHLNRPHYYALNFIIRVG